VFDYKEAENLAVVARTEDCIGCASCIYICPSQCIAVDDVEQLRPFHRIEKHAALIDKFLQAKQTSTVLTAEDWEEAAKDVNARMFALAHALVETMGRATKAVGRAAGGVAAEHLPEMYEETTVEALLERMQGRFKGSFDFDYKVAGDDIEMNFHPCGLYKVVTDAGEKAGEAVLCQLFHDYWAGLIGTFADKRFKVEVPQVGESCLMKLTK
jgi:ferredoxin